MEADDLCYEDLPTVDPAEYYDLGQCIRNKKPYPGEPEKMVIEVHPNKDSYVLQVVEIGGKAGWRERMGIKDAHHYYGKV